MTEQKALIAMSGGVDSSVAAYMMLQRGYTCVGATMRLYDGEDGSCCALDSVEDARSVAYRLGIPFHVFNFTADFREKVMDDFVRSYESGLTPNPCIQCNRHLKFSRLLDRAMLLGCEYVVTGHYARILRDDTTGRHLLYKATDSAKDQSYFLYALTQEQISHLQFPLGELTKPEVRQIAQEQGFLNARKRDSQDICFIPDGDYAAFLRRHTGKQYPTGNFLDTSGKIVGNHCGAVNYTLGQRKGLGIAMGEPVYVCAKDMTANTVTVGRNEDLMRRELLAEDCFFFPFPTLTAPQHVKAKTRSRMAEQPATVYPAENGMIRVVFDAPQRAITPGQAVVLYDGDLVIGGGTICRVIS